MRHQSSEHFPEKNGGAPSGWWSSDDGVMQLFPAYLLQQSHMHWTPWTVALQAAAFLSAEPDKKILDIGSGCGKFCLIAGYYYPKNFWYGIEQRTGLVDAAEAALLQTGLSNVHFITGDFRDADVREYDHFYCFNAFHENLDPQFGIDQQIERSADIYAASTRRLFRLLQSKPAGTRYASFHSSEAEMPADYHVVASSPDQLLKCWIKI